MPIAITPEHNDLADSVRSLVARVAPSEVLHEALETPIPNPPPYWKAAADQGLHGVHLAESVGGQGFGILELAIVIAEFGYGAVPGPFVPSAIASALISAHDPHAKLLGDLASGATIATYALESSLTATRQGDALVIRGEARSVPAAAQASVLVLPVAGLDPETSGTEWVVLDADAAGDRTGQERRPAAAGRPRAGQRRRGHRRPGAEQPQRQPPRGRWSPRCCRPRPSASPAGPPTPPRPTPRSASSSAGRSGSSRPSSTSARR